jgi:hypothetical protein
MANVRKRKLPSGLIRWQASYVDGAGERRFKMFDRKSAADAWLIETGHALARGLHTPDSVSPSVRAAGALWLKRCQDKGLEPMTVKGYEEHCNLHLYPFIGTKKLSELTLPRVDRLCRVDNMSRPDSSRNMRKTDIRSRRHRDRRYLKDAGITLSAADSPDAFLEDTPTAVMIRQILGSVSQFEKAMLVAKLKGEARRQLNYQPAGNASALAAGR